MASVSGEIFVVSGEPSGDLHAAHLIRELRKRAPGLRFRGYGGERMRDAGVELLHDLARDAIMGIFPVIKALPLIRRLMNRAVDELKNRPPAALLLTDYPGFNLRLAVKAHRMGIPVIYFIGPQVWAWGRHRIRTLAENIDLMLVILPFEKQVFEGTGLRTEFVGHPLLDHLASHPPDSRVVADLRAFRGDKGPLIGVFPGSRRHVVKALFSDFLTTCRRLDGMPGMGSCRFVIAAAQESYEAPLRAAVGDDPRFRVVAEQPYEVMAAMDLGLSTSGTTTLEIAAAGKPFVLAYRVSPLTYGLGRLLISVKHIGLVNLVLDRALIPEHIGVRSIAERCAKDLHRLWTDPKAFEEQVKGLAEVRTRLDTRGSYLRAAEHVYGFLLERASTASVDPAPSAERRSS
jgi:lipid-A-disaccharide synthase